MTVNILISGVGGQGTLLASRVLGNYAMLTGNDCKLSEIHGMSQRGGSVVTHVRIGEKIYSPVIWEGSADIVLAFETLEASRVKHFLKKDGAMLVNEEKILPMPCIVGSATYPDSVKDELLSEFDNCKFVNAREIALLAGNEKATNVVMLGCLCKLVNLDKEIMEKAVENSVPEKFRTLNLTAFRLGYDKV